VILNLVIALDDANNRLTKTVKCQCIVIPKPGYCDLCICKVVLHVPNHKAGQKCRNFIYCLRMRTIIMMIPYIVTLC